MNEQAYQDAIQPLSEAMRTRASELADYLVTQPARRDALRAALDFGWWCLGQGARHAHDVQERICRQQLARHGDEGATKG
jgi:hypothetical protein